MKYAQLLKDNVKLYLKRYRSPFYPILHPKHRPPLPPSLPPFVLISDAFDDPFPFYAVCKMVRPISTLQSLSAATTPLPLLPFLVEYNISLKAE